MKKILAMILALAMILSMSAFAFATDYNTDGNGNEHEDLKSGDTSSSNVDVNVTAATIVYYVTVKWDSLDFTYTQGSWDVNNHQYNAGTWTSGNSATVTVMNHSNQSINYTATFMDDTMQAEANGVRATLTASENDGATDQILASATTAGFYMTTDAATASITVTVEVIDDLALTNSFTVGTVRITLY